VKAASDEMFAPTKSGFRTFMVNYWLHIRSYICCIYLYALFNFKIIRFSFISVTYITDKPWRSGTNTAIS